MIHICGRMLLNSELVLIDYLLKWVGDNLETLRQDGMRAWAAGAYHFHTRIT